MSKEVTKNDWYDEKRARWPFGGKYEAWIVGADSSGDHQASESASAWVFGFGPTALVMGDIRRSRLPNSDEYRAAVGALAGVLEDLQDGTTITIYCQQDGVVRGLNEWLDMWHANGWKNSRGDDLRAGEIWKRIRRVRQERRLVATAVHVPRGDRKHDEIFGNLRLDAIQFLETGVKLISGLG